MLIMPEFLSKADEDLIATKSINKRKGAVSKLN
jgi:hypothetical protein